MVQLASQEKKIVAEYISLVRKRFTDKVSEIVLFGSKARGDSNEESDIDLLIVIDTENRKIKRDILGLCWDVMFDNDFKAFISPIVFSKKQYNRYLNWNSSFLHNVFREGVKL